MTEELAVEERYKTLANGAIYDMQTKRIVSGKGITTKITPERAIEMQSARQEKKRRAIEAGAQAAVMDKMPDAFTGDDGDWIEAVAQQVAYKALDKLDPKQVDAARFLLQESGLAEAKQVQATPAASVTDILRDVASIAASLAHGFDNSNYRKHEEGQVVDAAPMTDEEIYLASVAQEEAEGQRLRDEAGEAGG